MEGAGGVGAAVAEAARPGLVRRGRLAAVLHARHYRQDVELVADEARPLEGADCNTRV